MTSRLTACLALAFVLGGCAGSSSSVSKQPDDGFVLGQTTRQEILQRLGSPYREGTVTKNGKQLKTMTYAFGMGGAPNRPGINAARGQGFYFLDDKLAGYDFASSWKEDQTDFDATKVPGIKKGTSTRDDVQKLMLEQSQMLTQFIDQLTRINKGRAFFASPDRLGEYILVDYVRNKRRAIA